MSAVYDVAQIFADPHVAARENIVAVHNLGGMATANILAALDAGARWIEGAICGIGGGIAMPESLGSAGNDPTEDLAAYLDVMGVSTGFDAAAVRAAAVDVAAMLDITPRSHAGLGVTRESIRAPGQSNTIDA